MTFFCPGIIWFYYTFQEEQCNAPIENHMPGLVICYFLGSIILLVPAMNMCAKACCCDFCCVSFLHSVYLIGKLVLLIIMLVFAQLDYNKNWEENTCPELKDLTLFWLIFNYIMLAATFVYYIIFGGIAYCDCDYVDDYEYSY